MIHMDNLRKVRIVDDSYDLFDDTSEEVVGFLDNIILN